MQYCKMDIDLVLPVLVIAARGETMIPQEEINDSHFPDWSIAPRIFACVGRQAMASHVGLLVDVDRWSPDEAPIAMYTLCILGLHVTRCTTKRALHGENGRKLFGEPDVKSITSYQLIFPL